MHATDTTMAQIRAREILRKIVPWTSEASRQKPRVNYKGTRGRIGIVGGARDYAGAPYFASISSMRLGADLAYVICSRKASASIKNYSPDLIVTPILDCVDDAEFSSEIDCLLTRLHALVIGPGLGREKLLQTRAKQLIREAKSRSIPLVLDADSIALVEEDPSIIRSYPRALLTPNRIELQRLLNKLYSPEEFDVKTLDNDKLKELVAKCSRDLQVNILAKGMVDIIADSEGETCLQTDLKSGSDRRCGGQGDILSGIAGVYLYWMLQANRGGDQNVTEQPMVWAGYLAAITTRLCNELAFKEFGQGALASHMLDKVQPALASLLAEQIDEPKPSHFNYAGLLSSDEINRFNRQMIMEEFGPARQTKLKKASAIIIGAGGLGCPSAIYLGAAGIGRLGIVDNDLVETSNLHRQILHSVKKVGMLKTESIREAIQDVNPNVEVTTHSVRLTRYNAVDLIKNYDMVIDATDNLPTRYMISDACVVARKPLISGAALKMDGQLTVYNYDSDTPCFRCLFPKPPPPNAVGSCSENGVLGVIPGIIGVHQALEAIKIGAGLRPSYAGKMLIFDGQLGHFRHITISRRKQNCESCGANSKLGPNLFDYDELAKNMCQIAQQPPDILEASERITVEEYRDVLKQRLPHVLIDVRPMAQSDVSRFEHSIPIPMSKFLEEPEECYNKIRSAMEISNTSDVYVVCRKGIASQRGARVIQEVFKERYSGPIVVKDIIGGMTTWAKRIDTSYFCV